GSAGYADLPIDFRVVRLEPLVGDRPVGEVGARNRTEHAALVEIDLAKAPEIGGEVHAAAADALGVHRGRRAAARGHLGDLALVVAERLLVHLRATAEQLALQHDGDLVVGEIARLAERTLLEQHDVEAGAGELARENSARGASAHDDEVDGL